MTLTRRLCNKCGALMDYDSPDEHFSIKTPQSQPFQLELCTVCANKIIDKIVKELQAGYK